MANVLSRDKQTAVIGALAEGSRMRKPKRVGRPNLPKGHAKARIVPVRFKDGDLRRLTTAAKANKQTLSEWIRSVCNAAIGS